MTHPCSLATNFKMIGSSSSVIWGAINLVRFQCFLSPKKVLDNVVIVFNASEQRILSDTQISLLQ